MTENFAFLFQYLEKEEISINKPEFEFQIESHPDYPSLTSIVDTLSFLNINNGALSVKKSEIDLLPDHFIALLYLDGRSLQFYAIERKNNIYLCSNGKFKIALYKTELEASWQNIILLAEKPYTQEPSLSPKGRLNQIVAASGIGLFLVILFRLKIELWTALFFAFPSLGILFSVAALKDLFGTKNQLIDNFCNVASSSSCNEIINSKKWKFFEIASFSDLSMIFFSFQFAGLFISILIKDPMAYFASQKVMLIFALPVMAVSVYYQKFVEKKWCPICLSIISIMLIELGYVNFLLSYNFFFLVISNLFFALVLVLVILGWLELKNLLLEKKTLKEFRFQANRFIRNYSIFKTNLLASETIQNEPIQEDDTIMLGNCDAPVKIIMVTNPYCGYCEKAHWVMEDLLKKYGEKISFTIHFNYFDYENINPESKNLHQKLVSIYLNQGAEEFIRAMSEWFTHKDVSRLQPMKNQTVNPDAIDKILQSQLQWNRKNHITYTPAVIINGYFLPKQYQKDDIQYFINDLYEDEDFNINYRHNKPA